MKNIIPRVAAIHDISGFGRASLTVIMPILSNMGIQVCPMPTAVLSTHTGGFEGFKFIDLTDHLTDYMNHWKSLSLQFDSIYSGFLGSERQIEIVRQFIHDFKAENQLVVVDPVMGDDGKLYQTINDAMIDGMKELVADADMITPNITEAAYLLDREVPEDISDAAIKDWLKALASMGPQYTVITSVPNVEKGKRTERWPTIQRMSDSGRSPATIFPPCIRERGTCTRVSCSEV